MESKRLALAGLVAMMLVVSPAAHATLMCLTPLAPGASTPNVDDTCAGDLATIAAGSVVGNTGIQTFTGTGSAGEITNGTFEEEVLLEASGTLDFFLQVNANNTGSGATQGVESVNPTIFSVPGLSTLVGTVSSLQLLPTSPVGSFAPTTVLRDTSPGITWAFSQPFVTPGVTSFTMAVSTNAISFTSCSFCVDVRTADSGLAIVNGFEPTSDLNTVPEPLSLILLGTALALSALFIRRRQASKV